MGKLTENEIAVLLGWLDYDNMLRNEQGIEINHQKAINLSFELCGYEKPFK